MEITYQKLVELKACRQQLELFQLLFGSELELPTELEAQTKLAEALESNKLEMCWVEENLCCSDQRIEIYRLQDIATKRYQDLVTPYWNAYFEPMLLDQHYPDLYRDYLKVSQPALIVLDREYWLAIIQVLTNTVCND